MIGKSTIAAVLTTLFVLPALAQTPPAGTPTRIRGTVEKLEGRTLQVKSREGQSVTIALAPNYTVSGIAKRSLADIKPGDYVGAASMKGADGKLHALEVLIFPEAMKGVGEGHYPWDLQPGSMMTTRHWSAAGDLHTAANQRGNIHGAAIDVEQLAFESVLGEKAAL